MSAFGFRRGPERPRAQFMHPEGPRAEIFTPKRPRARFMSPERPMCQFFSGTISSRSLGCLPCAPPSLQYDVSNVTHCNCNCTPPWTTKTPKKELVIASSPLKHFTFNTRSCYCETGAWRRAACPRGSQSHAQAVATVRSKAPRPTQSSSMSCCT